MKWARPGGKTELDGEDLRLIAVRQRRLILAIAFALLLYAGTFFVIPRLLATVPTAPAASEFGPGTQAPAVDPARAALALNLFFFQIGVLILIGVVQLLALYGLIQALHMRNAPIYLIGALVPCVSLIVLLVVNQKATNTLQRAGIRVGFLGANAAQIR